MTGRIGAMGTPPHEWYYAGRDHVFFAAEPDIHHDSLDAFALPPLPPPFVSGSRAAISSGSRGCTCCPAQSRRRDRDGRRS